MTHATFLTIYSRCISSCQPQTVEIEHMYISTCIDLLYSVVSVAEKKKDGDRNNTHLKAVDGWTTRECSSASSLFSLLNQTCSTKWLEEAISTDEKNLWECKCCPGFLYCFYWHSYIKNIKNTEHFDLSMDYRYVNNCALDASHGWLAERYKWNAFKHFFKIGGGPPDPPTRFNTPPPPPHI